MNNKRVLIIGAGGIGGFLLQSVVGYLALTLPEFWELLIIDGDTFEPNNLERQVFIQQDNKAVDRANFFGRIYLGQSIRIEAIPRYVAIDPEDTDRLHLRTVLREGDIVMLCVDNHATRVAVAKACDSLADVTLISGGNNLDDGNVQVVMKRCGVYITPLLTTYHPEIAEATDLPPWLVVAHVPDCNQVAVDNHQIGFVNQMIAAAMGLVLRMVIDTSVNPDSIPTEIMVDALMRSGKVIGPSISSFRIGS